MFTEIKTFRGQCRNEDHKIHVIKLKLLLNQQHQWLRNHQTYKQASEQASKQKKINWTKVTKDIQSRYFGLDLRRFNVGLGDTKQMKKVQRTQPSSQRKTGQK